MRKKSRNLGILAHVSAAQAIALSFPHQETALHKNKQDERKMSTRIL